MSKQDLIKKYQAKKEYLQLSHSKDQMYNKVFATYEMVITSSSSLKIEFDVLIEFDEFRPEYGIYYGCRIKNVKSNFTLPPIWDSIVTDLESILAKVNLPADWNVNDGEIWAFSVRLNDDEPANEAREGVCTIIEYLQQNLSKYNLNRVP